jgi:CARDB
MAQYINISASRIRRTVLAGLAICGVAGASSFASTAAAGIPPGDAVAPPPVGVVLTGPADLFMSNATPTTIRISNTGHRAAGPFSVLVSRGYIGDACNWSLAPVTKRVAGLAVGSSVTTSVPQSSIARAVTVDYLNEVAEANELNNSGVVPGTTIIC